MEKHEKPEYDTPEGIAGYLTDLDGLNRLSKDRSDAGYGRKERLHEFCVLGTWMTDTCGNFGKIMEGAPREVLRPCPKVMRQDEMFRLLKEAKGSDQEARVGWSFSSDLPRSDCACPVCGLGWTIESCHDAVVRSDQLEVVSLNDFVGRTFSEAKESISSRTGRVWLVRDSDSEGIRSDRLIDLRPDPRYPTLKVNERGWSKERTAPDYVIQEGDDIGCAVFTFFHAACNRARINREELDFFRTAFEEAGLQDTELVPVPNEYCPCERCGPWYLAKHPLTGTLKVGWRKRVINLDWSATGRDLLRLFEGEDVTKSGGYIHAWGKEKLVSYLALIVRDLRGRRGSSQASPQASP